jgi:hypothetical protein
MPGKRASALAAVQVEAAAAAVVADREAAADLAKPPGVASFATKESTKDIFRSAVRAISASPAI